VALVHTVFGAIVRISGSGMGCGDNWPKCYGYWFPPLERRDLIIEVTHRYLAIALFASIAWLVIAAWRSRAAMQSQAGAITWNGARIALGLWFAPALFGAVTVFTGNPAWATVVHKLLAASLLAVLTFTTISAGGLGGTAIRGASGTTKAVGRARSVAIGALMVVVLGGLTAKLPGAAVACVGFPLCGEGSSGDMGQHVQLTHRLLAYLVVLDLITLPFIFRSRREAAPVMRAAWLGLTLGVLQVGWAAWMVTGGFPPVIRSLHQATGILIFVTSFAMLCLARLASPRASVSA
jgi:heme A synthase